ncbi:GPI transamidase component GAA1 [Magnaporthiopsis poae ATCC 64411]|uniref:GPI transamidase component GAA1 n=1 Tax=Magnaporthiopsis poae (strain ATCC 64411 / 73-15) TaxID=644358 RepID=A0A0C4EFG9_MAGP6|nr:GPI transamidase component GAA1 [Magnaporthiopsis poae ATCC 64411]
MLRQGLGASTGAHSCFMPYHVDAVTLSPHGDGWQDEMALGRVVEGTFRSLNNLLEHLHQSFFFYLLMHRERFVSIGTYLPSAMLVAANFTIMAVFLWFKAGQTEAEAEADSKSKDEKTAEAPRPPVPKPAQRDLLAPLCFVALCHFLGVVPLYLFNHLPEGLLVPFFFVFACFNAAFPRLASILLTSRYRLTLQQYQLIHSFSLLLLGMFVACLATLNFSLAFWIGLLCSPLPFFRPSAGAASSSPLGYYLNGLPLQTLVSVPVVVLACCYIWGLDLGDVLRDAAFAWNVWGTYTPLVVWCVWWPAWLASSVVLSGGPMLKKA